MTRHYAATQQSATFCDAITIGPDSPWFSGHFPGDPILPGVAQLDLVWHCINAAHPDGYCLAGLQRVKFKKIIRPGEALDISVTRSDKNGSYLFTITNRGEEVCSGSMRCIDRNHLTATQEETRESTP